MTDALPPRVRDWAVAHAPEPVLELTPLGGGYTQTKWLLRLASGDQLVLRWADPDRWGDTGREHVRREALACGLLADSELPVPRLLAVEFDFLGLGAGADLLSWRPGRSRLDPLGPAAILALAELAVGLHRQLVPTAARPPTSGLRGSNAGVPSWTRRPELWRRALELGSATPPVPGFEPDPWVLLHGDFHLGNILWIDDTVTGLIDWAETAWGPADLDVAHLCCDLAMLHGLSAAQDFRAAYRRRGGRLATDPDLARFWIVRDVLGFLPDPAHILAAVGSGRPDLTPAAVRDGLEQLLASTLD